MSRRFALPLAVVLLTAFVASVHAAPDDDEDDILVTARRLPTPASQSGTSISSVSSEDIEARQTISLADALREVPGLWITRSGGAGGATSLFLRGAGSNQTKVLLDGIPLNDPTLGGQYNAFDLMADALDRVEVLRGSQSTLYGTEAIGGVVQLFSRRFRGPVSVRLLGEGGARGTGRTAVEVGGGSDIVSGGFFASFYRTENEGNDNAFAVTTVGGRLVVTPRENLEIGLTLRSSESRAEEPYDFGNLLPEDDNIVRERKTFASGLSVAWEAIGGLTIRAQASRLGVESDFENGPDTEGAANELKSDSEARVHDVLLGTAIETLRLLGVDAGTARDRLFIGFQYEEEESENAVVSPWSATELDATVRTRSWILQEEVTLLDRVDATFGVRFTDNDVFGRETVPSYALQYRHLETGTTVAGTYSMGIRAPTPLEYADPFVGNPDLTEEKSRSLDLGIRQELGEGDVVLGATWFRLEVDDLIAWDPSTFVLVNFNRTRTTGLEFSATWRIDDDWAVGGSYTHQDPKNLDAPDGAEDQLPNRPKDFGSLWVRYERAGLRVLATALASGGFPDTGIEGPDQDARDHPGRKTVINVAVSYAATENLRIYGRIENLLDDEYVENERAPKAPGIGLFAGVEIRF